MNHLAIFSGALVAIAGLILSGCDSSSEPNSSSGVVTQGKLVTYQCSGEETFTARLSETEAIADLPDNPNLALPRVESGSGVKYSDGTTT